MRIAVVFYGDERNRKGFLNAVHHRIKNMKEISEYTIDAYMIQSYGSKFMQMLSKSTHRKRENTTVYDGICYHNLWIPFSIIDFILHRKFGCKNWIKQYYLKRYTPLFRDYNLLYAQSRDGGYIALNVLKSYGIPYIITWRGSDIHTSPFRNRYTKKITQKLIQQSSANLFVSQKLLETSRDLCQLNCPFVIPNGVADMFRIYSEQEKTQLRRKYNQVECCPIITYIGGLVDIKNVLLLPLIFKELSNKTKAEFWVVGDGIKRKQLEDDFINCGLNVRFFGNMPANEIPDILNLSKILILPSKNEGMPNVVLEALACDVTVFASRVGGIPELLDDKYTFELDENFVYNISNAISTCIDTTKSGDETTKRPISWKQVAELELKVMNRILNH